MPFNSVAFVLVVFLLHVAVCATLENERKEGNLRRRRKARPRMNVAGSVKNLDQLKSLEVNIALIPLLGQNIQITSVRLVEPVINIEILEDGTNNLAFGAVTKEQPEVGVSSSVPATASPT